MLSTREDIKHSLFDLLTTHRINNPLAVTLSLKQGYTVYTDSGSFIRHPDLIEYQSNNRHFLNVLNTKVFRKRFTRYKKRLAVFPVFEGSSTVRTHLHLTLERPSCYTLSDFANLISDCWIKTNLGYKNIDVREIDNYDAWINYMMKSRSKNVDLLSSVDVENFYL